MLRKFIRVNREWCSRQFRRLPQARVDFEEVYVRTVGNLINKIENCLVIDIGGGRSCRFMPSLEGKKRTTIIGIDIASNELTCNNDVNHKVIVDVVRGLPFPDASIDLLVSRSVLEHLFDVEAFLAQSRRVTKPGGYGIHFFPSRFSPFALVNQSLPNSLSKTIMHSVYEDSQGICGFPAKYDRCWHTAFLQSLERNGFECVSIMFGYHQSHYYSFFAPLFVVFALYDWVLYALNLRAFCAYLIVVAKRKED